MTNCLSSALIALLVTELTESLTMFDEEELTQEIVDEMVRDARAEWDGALLKSGFDSSAMFLIKDETKWAIEFLAVYEQVKEFAQKHGFTMPPLKEGLTVNLS